MDDRLTPLDTLDPPDDWSAIEQRHPQMQGLPPELPRLHRIIVVLVALLVAAAAIAFVIGAFRGSAVPPTPSSPSSVVPVGAEGSLIYPDTTPKEVAESQSALASGQGSHASMLSSTGLAQRFIQNVLGWERGTYHRQNLGVQGGQHPEVTVRAVNDKTGVIESLTLVQPGTVGPGGVWEVASVSAATSSLDLASGQRVTSGDVVRSETKSVTTVNATHDGFSWGSYRTDQTCGGTEVAAVRRGVGTVHIVVPPDAEKGTTCGASVGGIVWVATTTYTKIHRPYPFYADSTYFTSLTAYPVEISLPENSAPAGLSTYTAPAGWSLEYPTGWHVRATHHVAGVRVSNVGAGTSSPATPPPGGFAVPDRIELTVSPRPRSKSFRPRDSQFPLKTYDFQPSYGPDHRSMLGFQANGLRFIAAITTGTSVPGPDVADMADVVSSIRFPALPVDKTSGGFLSLGSAGQYPEGRGTPTNAGSLGVVYVMRGPNGGYVLDLKPDSCGEGEDDTWDRTAQQILITCPTGGDIRYHVDGTPLPTNPRQWSSTLDAHPVVVAWDGTLLLAPRASLHGDLNRFWAGT